jgi:hypothetical protein
MLKNVPNSMNLIRMMFNIHICYLRYRTLTETPEESNQWPELGRKRTLRGEMLALET